MAHLAGQDRSSVTGRNLNKIAQETGLNPWNASVNEVKNIPHEKENPTPTVDLWRIPFWTNFSNKEELWNLNWRM